MTFVRTGGFYQLRLARGEDIIEALVRFVREHDIKAGFFSGIGAAEDVVPLDRMAERAAAELARRARAPG